MTVLVTGATGNVGSLVVDELLRRNVDVRAAVRPGGRAAVPKGSIAVPLDFEDPTTFASALEGVDRVFLVRPPHISDGRAFRPFVEAMSTAGVAHVVFLSVQGAGINPFVPHTTIERLLSGSLPSTFLRPSFFMQNLTTTHLREIRDRREIYVPAGRGRTNFIDIADIAAVAAVVLTEPGHERRAYELTGSEALTYSEVAEVLSNACGHEIRYRAPRSADFKKRWLGTGHDREYVNVMARIYALARLGLAAGTTMQVQRLLGRPPITLAEFAYRNRALF